MCKLKCIHGDKEKKKDKMWHGCKAQPKWNQIIMLSVHNKITRSPYSPWYPNPLISDPLETPADIIELNWKSSE